MLLRSLSGLRSLSLRCGLPRSSPVAEQAASILCRLPALTDLTLHSPCGAAALRALLAGAPPSLHTLRLCAEGPDGGSDAAGDGEGGDGREAQLCGDGVFEFRGGRLASVELSRRGGFPLPALCCLAGAVPAAAGDPSDAMLERLTVLGALTATAIQIIFHHFVDDREALRALLRRCERVEVEELVVSGLAPRRSTPVLELLALLGGALGSLVLRMPGRGDIRLRLGASGAPLSGAPDASLAAPAGPGGGGVGGQVFTYTAVPGLTSVCIECHQPGSLPAVVAAARALSEPTRDLIDWLFDARRLASITLALAVLTAMAMYCGNREWAQGFAIFTVTTGFQAVMKAYVTICVWADSRINPPLRLLPMGLDSAAHAQPSGCCGNGCGAGGTGTIYFSALSQAAQAVWEGRCEVGSGWSQRARLEWLLEQWRVVQEHEGMSDTL
ncbi:hypothetical protein GPECTOR_33g621 [Gonium pectorale]|uniref:Uncharacterized protein n=1 Tax=Gonium pectorale TaxID=33097 RepID=A0A150GD28_GONPE|nr:hypothetical protein GPECTOR_33g621 [Gonium pectorale]|eukprot:KXZ47739.1 hypothetical protein GPECTOR_33g621 [Gonium pectorale]